MIGQLWFISGTDTGVGKTVLTALLARALQRRGLRVAALKPICSGGRGDARALRAAMAGALTLDEINPWHFRSPIAPTLAARRDGKRVAMKDVLAYVRAMRNRFEIVLIEGAGGLLSPLGEGFDSRDLIRALRARPIVVCPNRLGAIGQALLVIEALSRARSEAPHLVLASIKRPDGTSRSNREQLAERLGAEHLHVLPWQRGLRRNGSEEGIAMLAQIMAPASTALSRGV